MTPDQLDALPIVNEPVHVTDPNTGVTTIYRQPPQLLIRNLNDPIFVWDAEGWCWEVGRNAEGQMVRQRGPSSMHRVVL